MTYQSYKKASNRTFDHLYDPVFKSGLATFHKKNAMALCQSAPVHIVPNFKNMFSERFFDRRLQYYRQQNSLPFNYFRKPHDVLQNPKPLDTTAFITQPILLSEPIEPRRWNEFFLLPPENRMKSVFVQTLYRESMAQTEPWLPESKLRDSTMEIPEIAYLADIVGDFRGLPSFYEVEQLEQARIRYEWERSLKTIKSKEEFEERLAWLRAFELEAMLAKERHLNECQNQRLTQVCETLESRDNRFKNFNEQRFQITSKRYKKKQKEELSRMKNDLERKMRKLKQKKKHSINNVAIKDDDSFKIPKIKLQYYHFQNSLKKDYERLFETEIKPKSKKLNFDEMKETRSKLWVAKNKVVGGSAMNRTNETLINIYNEIKNIRITSTVAIPYCLRIKERKSLITAMEEGELAEILEEEKCYQDSLLVQKIIKGYAIKNILHCEMWKNAQLIAELRVAHPIESLYILYPPVPIRDISRDSMTSSLFESEHQKNLTESMDKEFRELFTSLDVIKEQIEFQRNQQILMQAELDRRTRKKSAEKKARLERELKKKQDQMMAKIEACREKLSKDFLLAILPSVFERMADTEARNYIEILAKQYDQNGSETMNDSIEIQQQREKSFLHEFFLTEIPNRLERETFEDQQMQYLLAAHDALYEHIQLLPFDEIHDIRIICEDLVKELVDNIINKNFGHNAYL